MTPETETHESETPGSDTPESGAASGSGGTTESQDAAFLDLVRRGNARTRAVLCTLARHGVALRRDEPERAARLLEALGVWPVYKGGQFLFDLLEWEDFMLDGDPPPPIRPQDLAASLRLPLRLLSEAVDAAPTMLQTGPLHRTAAAFDLPLRFLTVTAKAALDGIAGDLGTMAATSADAPAEEGPGGSEGELPELAAGFHLYQDVVLGTVVIAGPLLDGGAR
ncbi:hypothetical protein [Streptomyces caeruleatus]|uniref:Uncharacterized protein n=1 Tax=Streptomyces caeruleatus TaxID=661399 RepID=A0A101TWW3_9ACTN|nr:hypothetical protein [Streptomyces caeruleatus]KUO00029.1 hypothetical protein AQJ67_24480 [Streptomyces caeruleatus]